MIVHEIVAIRKGTDPLRRAVELNVASREKGQDDKYEGLEVTTTIHLEGTVEELEAALGGSLDVWGKVVLQELVFAPQSV